MSETKTPTQTKSAKRPVKGRSTMLRLSWRSILAHKLRLLLTVLSVVLGTAFVSGSMMFTASLNSVFDQAISNSLKDVDATISAKIEGDGTGNFNGNFASSEQQPAALNLSLLDTLRADPEIAKVALNASTTVVVATADKETIQTGSGGSAISVWYDTDAAVQSPNAIDQGRAPEAASEVVINANAAEKYSLNVGDKIIVVDPQTQHEFEIVGTYVPADGTDQLGNNIALMQSEQGYIETYTDGEQTTSMIAVGETKHDQELVDYLAKTYPEYQFESAQKLADELTKSIKDSLSFVNYFLIAFGLIALLVGTFIIANTFSMIVAQRLKEFALLRALGVSKPQLTTSVVFESIIVGIIGSAIGVFAGLGLVQGIKAFMNTQGMPMADASLGLTTTSVTVPIVLGTIVTVISAFVPAVKAGSVRPVEAMRSTESASSSPLTARAIVGGSVVAFGVAAALVGAFVTGWETSIRSISVGIGAFAVIVGVFMASPAVSLPVVGGIGRGIGAPFGAVGKLAATNSRRNPRRTAATAFALTLGIALVTAIGMLSATMNDSVEDVVSTEAKSDYVLTGPQNGAFSIPAETPDAVEKVAGVRDVVTGSWASISAGKNKAVSQDFGPTKFSYLMNQDPNAIAELKETEGEFDLSKPDTMVANKKFAEAQGWKIGDDIPLYGSQGEEIGTAKLTGTYGDSTLLSSFQISESTLDDTVYAQDKTRYMVFILGDGSVNSDQLRTNLEEAVKDYLVVQVQTTKEYAGERTALIDQMMNILYALLGLSVIVAVLGIINTLALNVIERRQEIGMLRAVGTQRRQIRTMITVESIQIALYGAIMGILVGLGLGWSFLRVMSDQGLDSISIPWMQMLWMFVGSALIGVIAAIWPAQRAAKTPPLDAIVD